MDIEISSRPGYLSITVAKRQGVQDARNALQRIIDAIEASDKRRLLIAVQESEAIFNVADYGLLDGIARLAGIPGVKIALVADTDELHLSYRYVEALAAERNLLAKAFRCDAAALEWLLA